MDDDVCTVVRPSERDRVELWRLGELLRAGFPLTLAEGIAVSDADLHRVLDLIAAGCSHDLAAKIVL